MTIQQQLNQDLGRKGIYLYQIGSGFLNRFLEGMEALLEANKKLQQENALLRVTLRFNGIEIPKL